MFQTMKARLLIGSVLNLAITVQNHLIRNHLYLIVIVSTSDFITVSLPEGRFPNGTVIRYNSGGLQLRLDTGTHSSESGGNWPTSSGDDARREGLRLIHEAPLLMQGILFI
jgi:hypothetical protein